MAAKHENYGELIWRLARTDFTLRYHGSVLGYVWAVLKPLLLFLILNFVFSSLFNPRNGTQYYSLQLLVSLMLFNFFNEGTNAGMMSLLNKASLVTKIYVPRWTIIIAATINSSFIFLMNLLVIAAFFVYYRFIPTLPALGMLALSIVLTYAIIIIFSFTAAPLYLKFRDLAQIWEVATTAMFYAAPIVYPLSLLPASYHQIILANPMGFIIHFMKTGLTENHFPDLWQGLAFVGGVAVAGVISWVIYKKLEKRIAETV